MGVILPNDFSARGIFQSIGDGRGGQSAFQLTYGAGGNAGGETQYIASILTGGSNVLVVEYADSRKSQAGGNRWEMMLAQNCPALALGGVALEVNLWPVSGYVSGIAAPYITGDARYAVGAPLASTYADQYTPTEWRGVYTIADWTPANNYTRFGWVLPTNTAATVLPLLYSRAESLGSVTSKYCVMETGNDLQGGGMLLGLSNATDTGWVTAPNQDLAHTMTTGLGSSYIHSISGAADYSAANIGHPYLLTKQGQTVPAGKCFTPVQHSMLVACPGVRYWSWAHPGRTTDGFENTNLIRDWHLSSMVEQMRTATDSSEVILWISLGQNLSVAVTAAATYEAKVAAHFASLQRIVSRWKSLTGGQYIVIDTSYKSSSDAVGVETYYSVAAKQFAAANPGVLVLDTQALMGEYADYSSLMSDGIHLSNPAGRLYFAGKISDLLAAISEVV